MVCGAVGIVCGAVAIACCVGWLWGCAPAQVESPFPIPRDSWPNLVVFTFDTLRADALGVYGSEAGVSPAIDAFAAESIVFEQAVTTIGTTLPAHASLFTGLYPKNHGVRWNGDTLADEWDTVAETLSEVGYETAAFVGYQKLLTRGGLAQGFNVAESPGVRRNDVPSCDVVSRRAAEWLGAADRPSPFFLWVHCFDSHSPYAAGPYARAQFEDWGYDGELADGASTELFYSLGRELAWSDDRRRAVRALYDGEVPRLDRSFEAIHDLLRDRGELRDTLVVVTADHGQALGEHGLVGHGYMLWEQVLRVPLIVGGWHGLSAPRRVEGRTGLVDFRATLFEVLGLDDAQGVDGRSFAQALVGGAPDEAPYFAEVRDLRNSDVWTEADASAISVVLGRWKAIRRDGEIQLFDLANDPDEQIPLRLDPADPEHRRIETYLTDYSSDTEVPVGDSPSAETLEELRALGYVE